MNLKLKYFLIIFLIFISNNSFSKNIFDVSLENIFIGDSLIKYFSKKEINNSDVFHYPKSKKFIKRSFLLKNSKYQKIAFHHKKNDKNLTIYSIATVKFFGKDNIDICKSFMKKIVDEYTLRFNVDPINYMSPYKIDDGKSIAFVNDIKIKGGEVRMFCVDWSNVTEKKRGWADNFQLNISSNVLMEWLNSEAYN